DLSRAAYMGSAALHVIGDAIRRAAAEGVDLSVRVAADSAPHRVLVLTGLHERIGVSIVAPPPAEVAEADRAHDG
ncbi:MAG TPA: STAS domain-containing protein, partial [Miltoncostaeaceae bacterium]|nr:STAS domain-containing protein [Miltoncostaeaceae bacterium]